MTRSISISLISLVILCSVAQAEEPYDITSCWSGDVTYASSNEELVIFSFDLKGVSRSNIESKAFHNWSFQIIGVVKVEAGKYSSTYYGKYLSPEGDFIIGEGQVVGDKGTWKFIQGSGKWKGIKGGGTNRAIRQIKAIKQGTSQGCSVAVGTYELPK
jgi:hypothetical protein